MPEGTETKVDLRKEIEHVTEWIKDYVAKAGAKSVVVGLSGGIDSAVVATLCVRALGADNVVGVNMPCNSNPQDQEHAKLIADHLGMNRYIAYDLAAVYDCLMVTMRGREAFLLLEGANIKARLRMTTLYSVANASNKGRLVVGNGGTDFEPICDFYKGEVREMARILGVPQEIIDKPPSAGLWEGQTDEGELGMTYEELDKTLVAIERVASSGNLLADQEQEFRQVILVPYGISFEQYDKVCDMMAGAKHKTEPPPYYHAWVHLD
jgi:NAD+ synthase